MTFTVWFEALPEIEAPLVLLKRDHAYEFMPKGAVCALVVPAQKGPAFEMSQVGGAITASTDRPRFWLPTFPRLHE